MKGSAKLVVEVALICAIAAAVGLTVNALRADNSLTIGRNYFATVTIKPSPPAPDKPTVSSPADARPAARDAASDAPDARNADGDLGVQVLAFDEVRRLFEDPEHETGGVLFIDARNDDHYNDGHIPGAVQLDHYNLDKYLPDVLARTEDAEKIIIYCNGGDCEDSLFAGRDLLDQGVPYESIYLYPGGWEEWAEMDMPVEKADE